MHLAFSFVTFLLFCHLSSSAPETFYKLFQRNEQQHEAFSSSLQKLKSRSILPFSSAPRDLFNNLLVARSPPGPPPSTKASSQNAANKGQRPKNTSDDNEGTGEVDEQGGDPPKTGEDQQGSSNDDSGQGNPPEKPKKKKQPEQANQSVGQPTGAPAKETATVANGVGDNTATRRSGGAVTTMSVMTTAAPDESRTSPSSSPPPPPHNGSRRRGCSSVDVIGLAVAVGVIELWIFA
ncbi:MAG: hypothetical protein Q9214_002227 [Letrouitia sp. 1 TL-2023]